MTDILNTGNFSMDKAATSAGWLHSLRYEGPVKSETAEYGISSFVYRYSHKCMYVNATRSGCVCLPSPDFCTKLVYVMLALESHEGYIK